MSIPKVFLYGILLLLFLSAGGKLAHAQDGRAILQRLEEKYQATQGLRADFKQTTTSPFSNGPRTFSGTLLLKGNRYRVETDRQTLVTNGETTWVYTPSRGQVIVSDYTENETAFVPSEFFYHYRDRFTVESIETTEQDGVLHYLLHMQPQDENTFYRRVMLWVRADDALITRLKVVDANGTQMVFDLKNVEFDPTLSAEAFTFEPPPQAEVIDLRS